MATQTHSVGMVNSGGGRALTNSKAHWLKRQETTELLALDLIEQLTDLGQSNATLPDLTTNILIWGIYIDFCIYICKTSEILSLFKT